MINGFLVVNKKKGITSAKVVGIVKHLFYSIDKNQKIGHCGTLDPDGEGVLPIALGRATRLFDFFLDKTKTYYTEFTFGIETDTLDLSGNITNTSTKLPSIFEVEAVAKDMLGTTLQYPPMYSARNYKGQRAYDLARSGIIVDLQPKKIEILSIDDIKEVKKGTFSMCITCSSGTYIRSIARDMSVKLDTVGVMSYIKRIKSGVFDIKDSISIEELEQATDITKYVLPMDYALKSLESISITRGEEVRLLRGFSVKKPYYNLNNCKITIDDELIALGSIKDGCLNVKSWLNSRAPKDNAKMVLALGYFDGLHIGHQAILDRAKLLAVVEGWTYATIFPEKLEKLGAKSKNHLFTYHNRIKCIEKYGVKPYYLPADECFFAMSKEEFCSYIKDEFAPSYIVVGKNFRFGNNREGDVDFLMQWFSDTKTKVEVVDMVECDGKVVSTTYIKELFDFGETFKAQSLLKYPYILSGYTQKGRGDGRKMGLPTFNLAVTDNMFLPKIGVYSAKVMLQDKEYDAVVNIGPAPTFDVDKIIVEAHILGDVSEKGSVYIDIIPVKYLRDIVKFSTKEELIAQINKDMESVLYD